MTEMNYAEQKLARSIVAGHGVIKSSNPIETPVNTEPVETPVTDTVETPVTDTVETHDTEPEGDILNRVDIKDTYPTGKIWEFEQVIGKNNLENIPEILKEKWDTLKDSEFVENLEPNDKVIVSLLG